MSQKIKDDHNRWRSKKVTFRMSPEEVEQLDRCVKLSGLRKQDYLIRRVLQRDVIVHGNPRVYKALRDEMASILVELQRLGTCADADDEFRLLLYLAMTIVSDMGKEAE